jgi:hypothetical protein
MTEENAEQVQNDEEKVDAPKQEESTESKLEDLEKDELVAYAKKLRREAASKRVKNSELEKAAEKWKEYEESQKTELQKLTERTTKAEDDAKKAAKDALRERVLRKFKIDEELEDLLVGETEEELTAKAEKLASVKGKGEKKAPDFFAGQRGKAVEEKAENLNDFFLQMWKDADAATQKRSF